MTEEVNLALIDTFLMLSWELFLISVHLLNQFMFTNKDFLFGV